MITRTFEQLVNHPELKSGTLVKVRIEDRYFEGKVVGKSGTLLPSYIVECTDGFIPNKTYNYKYVSMPLSEIFEVEIE